MKDLERDIRELLDDEARSAPPPRERADVIGRTRRRQGAVVVAGTLAVLAFAAASFVGLRAVVTADRSTPAGRPTVTTTINGISMSHPEGWHVVDPDDVGINEPGSTDLPRMVLVVAPVDAGLAFGCASAAQEPALTFLMTIQEEPLASSGPSSTPWPVELRSTGVDTTNSGCFPSWQFLRAGWTAAGRTFEARAGFAPDVSDADQAALLEAFASMTFEPHADGPTAVVLATGTTLGEEWSVTASNDGGGLELGLKGESFGAGIGGLEPSGDELYVTSHVIGEETDRQLIVVGAVPADAVRLGLEVSGGEPVALPAPEILDVPDEIDPDLNAFVFTIGVDQHAVVTAFDASNQEIASGEAGPGGSDPVETPTGAEVLFRGRTNDCFWTLYGERLLSDTAELTLVSRDGELLLRERVTVNSVAPPLQLASYTCDVPPGGVLVFGLATNEVAEIRWEGVPQSGAGGPPECIEADVVEGFCLLLEDFGSGGEAIAFDAEGNEIGRASFG